MTTSNIVLYKKKTMPKGFFSINNMSEMLSDQGLKPGQYHEYYREYVQQLLGILFRCLLLLLGTLLAYSSGDLQQQDGHQDDDRQLCLQSCQLYQTFIRYNTKQFLNYSSNKETLLSIYFLYHGTFVYQDSNFYIFPDIFIRKVSI